MSKSTIFSFRHPPDRNCQINQYHFSGVLGRWITQGFKGLAKKKLWSSWTKKRQRQQVDIWWKYSGASESPGGAQGKQPPRWLLLRLLWQSETFKNLPRRTYQERNCNGKLWFSWVQNEHILTKNTQNSFIDASFRKEEVTDLYICGIATDVCVGKLGMGGTDECITLQLLPFLVLVSFLVGRLCFQTFD